MGFFSSLFSKDTTDYAALVAQQALIIDVRSPQEFATGHIPGSENMPLNRLSTYIAGLKAKNKVVITCCASGTRSGMATKVLAKAGIDVYNGGSWKTLQRKIN
ncbi:rhodanese-related sulfurtransferase [Dyadobacter jejuensis]|uniref:Rhodanese-related sulfurtransferase n=1 Tax=Dyadobacter jejuensis TaxID=1082580 RepID=A0A316ALK7_9BACT|nr:rhodanese-like domain-containing protein [Dyadobacter jejuensis]PWJ58685.1 rhodanese-related sulfurtransferase [Dyadobacter jejuensis]